VTTARLYLCSFAPENVDPKTGEIDYASATLDERPFLVYEHPLPRRLQLNAESIQIQPTASSPEFFVRMHILVIHSENLADLLPDLASKLDIH
jgi:hypothetical protein